MEILPSLVLFSIAALFTPGPNNIMLTSSGLNFGVRASLPHLLGICLGFPTMFLVLGFGLGHVFNTYPLVHQLIKVVGVAYLLYLAWLIANTESIDNADSIANADSIESQNTRSKPLTFVQAGLFQWVNPKAWAISSGAIAAYTSGGDGLSGQILLMASVFLVLSFPSALTWLCFGRALKKLISKPVQQRAFNLVMAALLIISVLPIIKELLLVWLG